MVRAMEKLGQVTEAIWEENRARLIFPIEDACLAFRISKETLLKLGENQQRIVIGVEDGMAVVDLTSPEEEIRSAYEYSYGLIQQAMVGRGRVLVEETGEPPALAKEFLADDLGLLLERNLPDEDLGILLAKLFVLHGSLRNKDGLYSPVYIGSELQGS